MRELILTVLLIGLSGCSGSKPNPVVHFEGSVQISDMPNDVPSLKRQYSLVLDPRARVEIEFHNLYVCHGCGGIRRMSSADLIQPDGRSVSFDIHAIADKIIDPLLVPKVEAAVKQISQMDEEYVASNPKEFVDETGAHWKRAGAQ